MGMKQNILVAALLLPFVWSNLAPQARSNPPEQTRLVRSPYTPLNLAFAAYNGRLEGIPSFSLLATCFLLGDVTTEDLIRAAIAQGRLSEAHLEDESFVKAVDRSIRPLLCATCH